MEYNETKNEIMTPEEMETNIQRFMQIRNDFYDSIKEIKPNVILLKETNKSLVAHFEVLRQISENAEKNIHKTIQASSKDMAQAAGKELAPLMEESLKSTIKGLDRSVLNAKDVLEQSMGRKYLKLFFGALCGCLLCGLASFWMGYSYSQKHACVLPDNFIAIYNMGLKAANDSFFRSLQKEDAEQGKRPAVPSKRKKQ